jgi:hypothetical protein
MSQTNQSQHVLTETVDASSQNAGVSSNNEKSSNYMPPLLLASNVLSATSYASFIYSIARITIFDFHPTIKTSRKAAIMAFAIPTSFVLAMNAVQIYFTDPPDNVGENEVLNLDYKLGLRFLIPSTIAGLVTFAKRFLIESLLSASHSLKKTTLISTVTNIST